MMILAEPNFMRDGYLFSPAMWDLANPSREMLGINCAPVLGITDGEGVPSLSMRCLSYQVDVYALGPAEACTPSPHQLEVDV